MCTYSFRHVLWQGIATFLLRNGSRNAFDADRNSGCLPGNMLRVCGETWDRERLGERQTVTCSGNTVVHLARVPAPAMAGCPCCWRGGCWPCGCWRRGVCSEPGGSWP